jgi:hypothetical protein
MVNFLHEIKSTGNGDTRMNANPEKTIQQQNSDHLSSDEKSKTDSPPRKNPGAVGKIASWLLATRRRNKNNNSHQKRSKSLKRSLSQRSLRVRAETGSPLRPIQSDGSKLALLDSQPQNASRGNSKRSSRRSSRFLAHFRSRSSRSSSSNSSSDEQELLPRKIEKTEFIKLLSDFLWANKNAKGEQEQPLLIWQTDFTDKQGKKLDTKAIFKLFSLLSAAALSVGEQKLTISLENITKIESVDHKVAVFKALYPLCCLGHVNLNVGDFTRQANYFFLQQFLCNPGILSLLSTNDLQKIVVKEQRKPTAAVIRPKQRTNADPQFTDLVKWRRNRIAKKKLELTNIRLVKDIDLAEHFQFTLYSIAEENDGDREAKNIQPATSPLN